ncbi:hypothetical protein [Bacillus wiedmannii]|uniref:hypothetical protein n=1 Tax=Bacillus wiedmannii TaxID=1890302 RepID=UPI000BF122F7|nr:hypothetical protein [Bacillus wiedmannii]PEM30145.1 hypothetical protein CN598_12500 [Bacillus wiedmannii]
MRQKTPLEKLFNELENKHLKEVYDAYKGAASMMYQMKKAFIDAGFTENQAMELVVSDYLANKQIAREEN